MTKVLDKVNYRLSLKKGLTQTQFIYFSFCVIKYERTSLDKAHCASNP